MKICTKCNIMQPLSEYHVNRHCKDGHLNSCRSCEAIYHCRRSMITRCYNKDHENYHNYGGRGIRVCSKWLTSKYSFYKWSKVNGARMGLQIDRIDNDGDYTPENCRYTTPSINTRNTRVCKLTIEKVKEIKILLKEGSITQRKIAKQFGVGYKLISKINLEQRWTDVIID